MTFPSEQQIFEYIRNNGGILKKKQMAEDLQVDKNRRAEFRHLLQHMERNKAFAHTTTNTLHTDSNSSPDLNNPSMTIDNSHIKISGVGIFIVDSITHEGDMLCRPESWIGSDFPKIYLKNASVRVGDRILARTHAISDDVYMAKVIKVINPIDTEFLGICKKIEQGFHVTSTNKRDKNIYFIHHNNAVGTDNIACADGDIAIVVPIRGKTRLLKNAKIKCILGNIHNAHAYSLLSILKYDIPHLFPDSVLQQTQDMTVPKLGSRTDLTHLPLVTIDGADARDFDDAVYAEKNDMGFTLWVAIADVAHYVRPHTPLCSHAIKRGNSTYFVDRVVPMLPEKLSNDLCSLIPHKKRACIAVAIDIDMDGNIQKYRFVRGIMQSHARLTYEQVQSAYDGVSHTIDSNLMPHIHTLYAVYQVLMTARNKRGTLDLEIPEKYVTFNAQGEVDSVYPRTRLNSHKLIEECMICANVAATKALQDKNIPHIMYRVHDVPPLDKLETLQQALQEMGLSLPKGTHLTPHHFTRLLHQVQGTSHAPLLSELILRSQSQAQYSPENIGHFGLALQNYCHFTSPIRRYSDILIHRALIDAYNLGNDGMDAMHPQDFNSIAENLCNTERRSQQAERETMDRYLAHYLDKQQNTEVHAHITGITERAIFLTLTETGADAVVFLKTLDWDYFLYSPKHQAVIGECTHHVYTVGDRVMAEILNISPIKGGIQCNITDGGSIGTIALPHPKSHRKIYGGKPNTPRKHKKNRFLHKNTHKKY